MTPAPLRLLSLIAPATAAATGLGAILIRWPVSDPLDQATGWVAVVCAIALALCSADSGWVVLVGSFGAAWFLGSLAGLGGAAGAVGALTVFLHRAVFAHLLLALAFGRTVAPRTRLAFAAAYPVLAVPVVWSDPRVSTFPAVLIAAACTALAVRSTRAVARGGRTAAVIAAGSAAIVAAGGIFALTGDFGWQSAVLHAYEIWFAAGLAVATLQIVAYGNAGRSVTERTVEMLGAGVGSLERALANALGDPELRLGFRLGRDSATVDANGRPVDSARPGRVLTQYGEPVFAAVEHGVAVLDDPATADALETVVRLAQRNAALRADLADRVALVEASSERLVASARATSERFVAQLHGAPLARLDSARTSMTAASALAADGPIAAELDDLIAALDATTTDLIEIAKGLRPTTLRERGLVDAIRVVVSGTGARFTDAPISLSAASEAAMYFTASEAIANALKHAAGAAIDVSIATIGSEVVLRVTDDGPGVLDADASMLSGPRERIVALGGRIDVESSPGHGTTVVAAIAFPEMAGHEVPLSVGVDVSGPAGRARPGRP